MYYDSEETERAVRAYGRRPDLDESRAVMMQPARDSSGLERHNGIPYVVLRNCNGVLAVFRVTKAGRLRRLRRRLRKFETW